MKILGIGESVIDSVHLSEQTEITKELSKLKNEKHVGEPILIAMILLARLEMECTFVTTLGRDMDAKLIRKLLKYENVTIVGRLQKKTKVNTILVNPTTGQRTKLRGKTIHPSVKNLERKFLHQFDIIMIDRHQHEAFYEVLRKKKPSTKIVIDPGVEISRMTLDMIKYADYPIIPIESLTKVANQEDLLSSLQSLYQHSQKEIIITAGELGSILYNGKKPELIPALQIRPIDTCGAGDIYRGAFVYGIAQNWKISACIRYANCVSAMHCTRLGNAAAIPTKQEIDLCMHLALTKKQLSMPILNNYYHKLYQTL